MMEFGQALAQALSLDALRETVWRPLPGLTGGDDVWVVLRSEAGWDRLTDIAELRWPTGDLESIAETVLARPDAGGAGADGLEHAGHVCFPMLVGAPPIGVTGLPGAHPSLDVRRKLGAAAALLTVAVRNAQLFAEVRDYGMKDALTGCYNRAHALEALSSELARSRRTGSPVSAVLFDVDNFKSINDRYGHLAGEGLIERADRALYEAKAAGRNCVRMLPRSPRALPATAPAEETSARAGSSSDTVASLTVTRRA